MGKGGMNDVEAVSCIHIRSHFSPVFYETIMLRKVGFIHAPLKEAQPVNLTACNSVCNTVHQKTSADLELQSGTTAKETRKGRKNKEMVAFNFFMHACVFSFVN